MKSSPKINISAQHLKKGPAQDPRGTITRERNISAQTKKNNISAQIPNKGDFLAQLNKKLAKSALFCLIFPWLKEAFQRHVTHLITH